MRRHWFLRALMIIPLVILALALFGFVVMSLWNWLTPALFGWKLISFWQAVGLVILARILFGGFRGHRGPGRHWRYRMMERWEKMTPEEREKFREGMRRRCGYREETAAKPTA